MSPITLVCIIVGFLSTISSLFKLLRPIYQNKSSRRSNWSNTNSHQHHEEVTKTQKRKTTLKSAQRFLLALALADLCGLILLLIIPLRTPTGASSSTSTGIHTTSGDNYTVHFLLLSAPLVPRPATLATLATLNLLSIIRGRPLRLGPFDAAIWVPAVLTSLTLLAIPLPFASRRFSTATSYIIYACFLTCAAFLVIGAFGRLLLAILRVAHFSSLSSSSRDGKTCNSQIVPLSSPKISEFSSNSPACTEETMVGRNSGSAHNVYHHQDDFKPRPSISSYVRYFPSIIYLYIFVLINFMCLFYY